MKNKNVKALTIGLSIAALSAAPVMNVHAEDAQEPGTEPNEGLRVVSVEENNERAVDNKEATVTEKVSAADTAVDSIDGDNIDDTAILDSASSNTDSAVTSEAAAAQNVDDIVKSADDVRTDKAAVNDAASDITEATAGASSAQSYYNGQVNSYIEAVKNAKNKEEAEEAYNVALKAITDANTAYSNSSKNYEDALAAYTDAMTSLASAQEAYKKAVADASGNTSAASTSLEGAAGNVSTLITEANTGLENTKNSEDYKLLELSKGEDTEAYFNELIKSNIVNDLEATITYDSEKQFYVVTYTENGEVKTRNFSYEVQDGELVINEMLVESVCIKEAQEAGYEIGTEGKFLTVDEFNAAVEAGKVVKIGDKYYWIGDGVCSSTLNYQNIPDGTQKNRREVYEIDPKTGFPIKKVYVDIDVTKIENVTKDASKLANIDGITGDSKDAVNKELDKQIEEMKKKLEEEGKKDVSAEKVAIMTKTVSNGKDEWTATATYIPVVNMSRTMSKLEDVLSDKYDEKETFTENGTEYYVTKSTKKEGKGLSDNRYDMEVATVSKEQKKYNVGDTLKDFGITIFNGIAFWKDDDIKTAKELIMEAEKARIEAEGGMVIEFNWVNWDTGTADIKYLKAESISVKKPTEQAANNNLNEELKKINTYNVQKKDTKQTQTKGTSYTLSADVEFKFKETVQEKKTETLKDQAVSLTAYATSNGNFDVTAVDATEAEYGEKTVTGNYVFYSDNEDLQKALEQAGDNAEKYQNALEDLNKAKRALDTAKEQVDQLNKMIGNLSTLSDVDDLMDLDALNGTLNKAVADFGNAKDTNEDTNKLKDTLDKTYKNKLKDLTPKNNGGNGGGNGNGNGSGNGNGNGNVLTPVRPVINPVIDDDAATTVVTIEDEDVALDDTINTDTTVKTKKTGKKKVKTTTIDDDKVALDDGADKLDNETEDIVPVEVVEEEEVLDEDLEPVVIEDEDVALAPKIKDVKDISEEEKSGNWWWLLIVAICTGTAFGTYKGVKKHKENSKNNR